jgi:DNA replication protein DnaC
MKDTCLLMLKEDLKALKLSTMVRDVEVHLRQAKDSGIGYDQFLAGLTAAELQNRAENRLARRVRDAKFPLIKPVEMFDFNAVPDLDIRLFRELCNCGYIKEHRNIIFLGRSGTGNYVKLLLM